MIVLINIKFGKMKMDLNKLRDHAYKTACEHGFHDKEYSDEHWLMLVISEIGEAVNADRKGKHADVAGFNFCDIFKSNQTPEEFYDDFQTFIKDSVEDELADIVIRLLDFAGLRNIDLSKLSGKLNERYYKLCLNGSKDEDFSEMMYCITKWICTTDNIKDKIECAIGGIFSVAYHYRIDLFQHIDWKMKYNELRPRLNGKEY